MTVTYLSPGENSYTYAQTQVDLYVDQRTNPGSGNRGMCGDCCGYLCSILCAGNCGNPGDGTMAPGDNGGGFGNIVITNGDGDPIGTVIVTSDPTPVPTPDPTPNPTPDEPPDFSNIVITGGTVIYLNPSFADIKITFGNP